MAVIQNVNFWHVVGTQVCVRVCARVCVRTHACSRVLSCVQLFVTRWNCSLPGSAVHGILQARILEWVAISSSGGSSPPRDQTWVSCISCRFFTTSAKKGH